MFRVQPYFEEEKNTPGKENIIQDSNRGGGRPRKLTSREVP